MRCTSEACLHCEISHMLMRRQAAGEPVNEQMIGEICQVLADMAASQPYLMGAGHVMHVASQFLTRFLLEILDGTYIAGAAGIHDPNSVRKARSN